MSHKVKQVSIYSLDKFSHLRNWIVFVLSSTTRAWIKRRHGFGFYFGSGTLGILAIIVLTLISADSYLCFMITSSISRRCWMSLGAILSCVCSSAWHQSRLFLYVFVFARGQILIGIVIPLRCTGARTVSSILFWNRDASIVAFA